MPARLAFVSCLLVVLFPIVSHGEVWNLADDFSATQNPNGTWSYGWRATAEQPLTIFTDNSPDQIYYCDYDQWRYNVASGCPCMGRNPYDYTYQCQDGPILGPLATWFHPGPAQQCVIRWTAPGTMQIQLAAQFTLRDVGSDVVHIYLNGSQVFSHPLAFLDDSAEYSATLAVQAGDVIDCAVDAISYYCDCTELDVVLTTVGPSAGACCFETRGCLVGTPADCAAVGGAYMGDGTLCEPDPCGATPVERTTWGKVKSLFR